MSKHTRLLYFNALFDLVPGSFKSAAIRSAADEMTALFLPLGTEEDFILLKTQLPDEHFCYLQTAGLNLPVPFSDKTNESNLRLLPWGWDEETAELSRRLGDISPHPSIPSVRYVNSREFLSTISNSIPYGDTDSYFVQTRADLKHALSVLENSFPLVIKPNFGSSGFGFIHLKSKKDVDINQKSIFGYLENSAAVIEPWRNRLTDTSSSINIEPDGSYSDLRHIRCIVNRYGTFNGALLPPVETSFSDSHLSTISDCIKALVPGILKAGYFGPVGIDSYTYLDNNGQIQLSPVVEINARHVVSDIARSLQDKLCPEKYCFLRFASRKMMPLPDSYETFSSKLGEFNFSLESKEGILLVTPLRVYNHSSVQPYRNCFFISADSPEKIFRLDEILLSSFSKKRRGGSGI
ncbi:hypothetical protein CHISP_1529 [Chitinispirillum alkaliphilum]|nr:hypothetical protein CHISP_1529 [Chitinispirillum alkaliphilum]